MKESFIFYKSFANAAATLGDKARLKLYDAIIKLGLCAAENEAELKQLCNEIESNLIQNRNVFAQFLLIKPQIIANFSRYINGLKGAKYGALGGAPIGNKNALKNIPETTPNGNENVNGNETSYQIPLTDKQECCDDKKEGSDSHKIYIAPDYHVAWDDNFQVELRALTEDQIGQIDYWLQKKFECQEIPAHIIRNALITKAKRENKDKPFYDN